MFARRRKAQMIGAGRLAVLELPFSEDMQSAACVPTPIQHGCSHADVDDPAAAAGSGQRNPSGDMSVVYCQYPSWIGDLARSPREI